MSSSSVLVIGLVLLAGLARGQVTGFPAWYRESLREPIEMLSARQSPAYVRAHPGVRPLPRAMVQLEFDSYRLTAQTNQGVLAVTDWFGPKDWGGIETGLLNVLGLDGPVELWRGGARVITIAGLGFDGCATVKALVLHPEDAACGSITLIDLPIRGYAGEVYSAASFVDGMIYAFEITEPQIIRFRDSDADGLPDQRDPDFRIDLLAEDMWTRDIDNNIVSFRAANRGARYVTIGFEPTTCLQFAFERGVPCIAWGANGRPRLTRLE